jgi:hypothetical protein
MTPRMTLTEGISSEYANSRSCTSAFIQPNQQLPLPGGQPLPLHLSQLLAAAVKMLPYKSPKRRCSPSTAPTLGAYAIRNLLTAVF